MTKQYSNLLGQQVQAPGAGCQVAVDKGVFTALVLCNDEDTYNWELTSRGIPRIHYGGKNGLSFWNACWQATDLAETIAREMKYLAKDQAYGL